MAEVPGLPAEFSLETGDDAPQELGRIVADGGGDVQHVLVDGGLGLLEGELEHVRVEVGLGADRLRPPALHSRQQVLGKAV